MTVANPIAVAARWWRVAEPIASFSLAEENRGLEMSERPASAGIADGSLRK